MAIAADWLDEMICGSEIVGIVADAFDADLSTGAGVRRRFPAGANPPSLSATAGQGGDAEGAAERQFQFQQHDVGGRPHGGIVEATAGGGPGAENSVVRRLQLVDDLLCRLPMSPATSPVHANDPRCGPPLLAITCGNRRRQFEFKRRTSFSPIPSLESKRCGGTGARQCCRGGAKQLDIQHAKNPGPPDLVHAMGQRTFRRRAPA